MQTETATLLAVLATPLAVVAAVLALTTVLLVRRVRRELTRTTARLMIQEDAVRADLASARAAIEATRPVLTRLQQEGRRLDTDVAAWTVALAEGRTALRRLTQGRLGPMVRAMQVAGALARIALLWRAPVR